MMDQERIKEVLDRVKDGSLTTDQALEQLRFFPYEDLEFATIDHHRALRRGFPEVIMGEAKTADQIISIMEKMANLNANFLVTRLNPEKMEKIKTRFSAVEYNSMARTLVYKTQEIKQAGRGPILVITAGTSDIPVAEEAYETAKVMGNETHKLYDVGVSGIHRILDKKDALSQATVIIVVAGMEGALPSVVGGLVARPVIAVPTSIGYGASFGGIAALLGMLNSCSPGVCVVNIDNGFGAGYMANLINRKE
jgi:NCAIR mutase (PurE)-related protein